MEELPKAYEPKSVEEKWYPFWESKGYFHADPHSKKPAYTISIPPPNVTGVLHMGHALVDTLQDVLIRWKRMSGYEALWVPGTDHAGIATQTVVERDQIAKTGKRRKDFPREEFVSLIWKWKETSEKQIIHQLKRLGCSCDWQRLCFTMDAPRNRAVKVMFKKMFDEGFIYRGDYLVNWDPVTQTALADDEVEHEERASFLWFFRYALADGKGYIVVATTRPETFLGDTAIAVNPNDPRYQSLIGKKVVHPVHQTHLPIIGDPFVDPQFGTGAVKITPAHDPNDYEMALRHHLPMINVMTSDGKINENGGPFKGKSMEEARLEVVDFLKKKDLFEKAEPHQLRVGVSYRSKAVIEPFLSKQWFVKMSPFKEKLINAVKEKRVTIIPSQWEQTYFHWIENLRDWCISRQLWWGHRIPIWYLKDNPEKMICFEGEGVPPEVAKHPDAWRQDEDVLDTWFSSALWPFSVLGWPDKTPELKKFYPNSTLITGHDILFFWVARMILMGEYALNQVPFPETFIHGLIYGKSYWRYQQDGGIGYITGKEKLSYDMGEPMPAEVHSKWEKMSKSKGNIIDPIEIIETYGTDAMRLGLCASATQARQIDLDRRRFEEYKNFINKIWNGARFVFMNIADLPAEAFAQGLDLKQLTLEDRWILSRLNQIIISTNEHLTGYHFDRVTLGLYAFFWDEFCAYYLELVKPTLFNKAGSSSLRENKQKILTIVLCILIRLLHPMAPFISEELFQKLKEAFSGISGSAADPYTQETIKALQAEACIISHYPQVIKKEDINPQIEEIFAQMNAFVHGIRNIRAEMQIAPNIATQLLISGDPNHPQMKLIKEHHNIITALIKTEKISYLTLQDKIPAHFYASALIGDVTVIVPLPTELKEKEKLRLEKEREKLVKEQNNLRLKLANEEFVAKAPAALVQKFKDQLEQNEKTVAEIAKKFTQLSEG